jgi:hypothetical protein
MLVHPYSKGMISNHIERSKNLLGACFWASLHFRHCIIEMLLKDQFDHRLDFFDGALYTSVSSCDRLIWDRSCVFNPKRSTYFLGQNLMVHEIELWCCVFNNQIQEVGWILVIRRVIEMKKVNGVDFSCLSLLKQFPFEIWVFLDLTDLLSGVRDDRVLSRANQYSLCILRSKQSQKIRG